MAQDAQRTALHKRQWSRSAGKSGTGKQNGTEESITQHDEQTQKSRAADEATAAFVRRVLCNKDSSTDSTRGTPKPLDELLPPLTSSNQIDLQLYAFVAVIVNQFVLSWYSKITPDRRFVDELLHIVAHCTRGLEQRLRETDVESLVLDELPLLLDSHVKAYHTARETEASTLQQSPAQCTYHTLRPHVALSPVPVDAITSEEQQVNESAWRQILVHGVLALLLPPEDVENPCLRILMAEVFSEMILGTGVSGRACEGWMLWEGVTKVISTKQEALTPNRLEQFGLLSSGQGSALSPQDDGTTPWRKYFGVIFWNTMHYIILASVQIRAIVPALIQASSIPPRSSHTSAPPLSDTTTQSRQRSTRTGETGGPRAMVSMAIWRCTSSLLSLKQGMPWLTGLLSLLQWMSLHGAGKVCRTNSRLDRLCARAVHTHILNPAHLPPLLQAARRAIFPNNALGPARTPPTGEEVQAIRRGCAAAIVDTLPDIVRRSFFATKDVGMMCEQVERVLDIWSDAYMNRHFVFAAVELLVVRLFPELAEQTVEAVLHARRPVD